MLCDFSTTIPIARTVSQVVMLDAFQQCFDYQVCFICGIPTITVKGGGGGRGYEVPPVAVSCIFEHSKTPSQCPGRSHGGGDTHFMDLEREP